MKLNHHNGMASGMFVGALLGVLAGASLSGGDWLYSTAGLILGAIAGTAIGLKFLHPPLTAVRIESRTKARLAAVEALFQEGTIDRGEYEAARKAIVEKL